MDSLGFKIAFGMADFWTEEGLDDPDYIRWVVQLATGQDQRTESVRELGIHKCTQDDWETFYPPSKEDDFYHVTERNFLYCIDHRELLEIRGQDNFDYIRLEIMYLPCVPDIEKGLCLNRTLEETK